MKTPFYWPKIQILIKQLLFVCIGFISMKYKDKVGLNVKVDIRHNYYVWYEKFLSLYDDILLILASKIKK